MRVTSFWGLFCFHSETNQNKMKMVSSTAPKINNLNQVLGKEIKKSKNLLDYSLLHNCQLSQNHHHIWYLIVLSWHGKKIKWSKHLLFFYHRQRCWWGGEMRVYNCTQSQIDRRRRVTGSLYLPGRAWFGFNQVTIITPAWGVITSSSFIKQSCFWISNADSLTTAT